MDDHAENTDKSNTSFNPLLIVGVVIILGIALIALVVASGTKRPQPATSHDQMSTKTKAATATMPSPTTTTSQASQSASSAVTVSVQGGNFYFKPNEIHVKKGQKVTINFTSSGGMHDFVLDAFNVRTNIINGGETATVSFTPDKTGSFEFYCSVDHHRQMGMKGTLVVE